MEEAAVPSTFKEVDAEKSPQIINLSKKLPENDIVLSSDPEDEEEQAPSTSKPARKVRCGNLIFLKGQAKKTREIKSLFRNKRFALNLMH